MITLNHLGSAVIEGMLAWICFRVSAGVVSAPLPLDHWAWGAIGICVAVAAVSDLLLSIVKSIGDER